MANEHGLGSVCRTKRGWVLTVSFGRDATGRRLRKNWLFQDEAAARAKYEEIRAILDR